MPVSTVTDALLPSKPIRLALYHDTTPENARYLWEKGGFDPDVRSRKIVYNQPSGIYCAVNDSEIIEFFKIGTSRRMVLELRATVQRPLDARSGKGEQIYQQLLHEAQTEAAKLGIDLGLADDRPRFGIVFTNILKKAGYDCIVLRGHNRGTLVNVVIILRPSVLEVIKVVKHYQYPSETKRSHDFLSLSLSSNSPAQDLPLPDWA